MGSAPLLWQQVKFGLFADKGLTILAIPVISCESPSSHDGNVRNSLFAKELRAGQRLRACPQA
jgi:hypothetical protein